MLAKDISTNIAQKVLRILLGLLMLLAGYAHMTFQRAEFQAQVPHWVPLDKDWVVLLSGVAELALGFGMVFLGSFKVWVGLALAVFYVLIFPGNIAQYLNGIDAFNLDTDRKRLIRLFFQPVLVLWALWSSGALKAWRSRSAP